MINKKESPARCGNNVRVDVEQVGKPNSISENSTESTRMQDFLIRDLLPHGEKNAIKSRELLIITGFKTVRELQSEIERERCNGAVILSKAHDGGGYFLPSDGEAGKEELERFIATVSARARHSFRSLKAARRALNEYE